VKGEGITSPKGVACHIRRPMAGEKVRTPSKTDWFFAKGALSERGAPFFVPTELRPNAIILLLFRPSRRAETGPSQMSVVRQV
jgi:hypothetical protein